MSLYFLNVSRLFALTLCDIRDSRHFSSVLQTLRPRYHWHSNLYLYLLLLNDSPPLSFNQVICKSILKSVLPIYQPANHIKLNFNEQHIKCTYTISHMRTPQFRMFCPKVVKPVQPWLNNIENWPPLTMVQTHFEHRRVDASTPVADWTARELQLYAYLWYKKE